MSTLHIIIHIKVNRRGSTNLKQSLTLLSFDNLALAIFSSGYNIHGHQSKLLSKPKLNQQLSSTEFEVRLHPYIEIHPTTHPPPGPTHTNSTCILKTGQS